MARRVTLKDVAKTAGVSLASASYAVNRTGSLGNDTREHILKIASEMGYRQNLSARATRTGKTGAIGFVVPDMANPFFPSLTQSIVQRARQHGYSVFVSDTEGDRKQEAEAFRQLIDRGVDGIIWFPVTDEEPDGGVNEEVPVVIIDRTIPGIQSIQADYREGGRKAIEFLQSLGHQKIGVVTGPLDVKSMRDRCEAAINVIRASGEIVFSVHNAFSAELENETKAAIESREATALFVGADLIAIGILKYAQDIGIRVPQDLSIVGFDDIPWAEFCNPSLTTIEMPVDEMAAEAVDSLVRRIDGEADSFRRVVFDVNLIERGTTMAREQ